jgi:hypothetical protein
MPLEDKSPEWYPSLATGADMSKDPSMKLSDLRAALDALPPGRRPPPKLRAAIRDAFTKDGAEAFRVLAQGDSGWSSLEGDAERCPWKACDREAMPWLDELPKSLASELRKRCLGLVAREIHSRWHLGYVLERGTAEGAQWYLGLYVGGPPTTSPELGEAALELRWVLPEALRPLYAVHDGLGPHSGTSFGVEAFLPAAELEPLPAVIAWDPNGSNHFVNENDFLAFYCDSVGNRRGFYRQSESRVYAKAFDWDRETRGVGQLGKPAAVIANELVASLRAG